MGGKIRLLGKWAPPPHPILQQDEIDGTGAFRRAVRSAFDDYFPVECLQASKKDRRALSVNYALSPVDFN
jgi:hypothetical protein